jgi:hypothetical protein
MEIPTYQESPDKSSGALASERDSVGERAEALSLALRSLQSQSLATRNWGRGGEKS